MEVLDTGSGDFEVLRERWIRNSDAFILVYNIASRASFRGVEGYYNQIRNEHSSKPIMLVGNKSDIEEREVSEEEGAKLADKWGCRFLEASAKYNSNVLDAFHKVGELSIEMHGNIEHNKVEGNNVEYSNAEPWIALWKRMWPLSVCWGRRGK